MKLISCEMFHVQWNSDAKTVSELENFCFRTTPKIFVEKAVLDKLVVCELYLELLKQAILRCSDKRCSEITGKIFKQLIMDIWINY